MSQSSQIETIFDDTQQRVNKVYAQALLETAGKQNAADEVVADLEAVAEEALDASPRLEAMLSNPRVDPAAKSAIIDRVFAGRVHPITLKFLKVLAARRRLDAVRGVAKAARGMLDEAVGRLSVLVTTAQPLDDGQAEQLRHRLQQAFSAEIRMRTRVDANILGGLIVRVGDTLYDASVEGRLRQMQRRTREHAEAAVRSRHSELSSPA